MTDLCTSCNVEQCRSICCSRWWLPGLRWRLLVRPPAEACPQPASATARTLAASPPWRSACHMLGTTTAPYTETCTELTLSEIIKITTVDLYLSSTLLRNVLWQGAVTYIGYETRFWDIYRTGRHRSVVMRLCLHRQVFVLPTGCQIPQKRTNAQGVKN